MKKIGCLFLQLSNENLKNFKNDKFFSNNAINSFKKWNNDINIIHVTNDNFKDYLIKLDINEYYDNVGILRIHLIKELLKKNIYDKVIMLGLDTFTCARLDEFINDNINDMVCSSGPPYSFLKTDYWQPKIISFEFEGKIYNDVDFINADVVCFNNYETCELLYQKSLEYWTDHAEQGGMNYLYQNQKELGIKVSIVDFPYIKTKSLYNVRSKGVASGGNQMYKGKVYTGNYKDPNSLVCGEIYPTSEYVVKEAKLYTKDNKQIKVFHYAEALGVKTKDEYETVIEEIKTLWFNTETKNFLIKECNCIF